MAKFYELALETQIRKLRNTAIGCLGIGGIISYNLLKYHHHGWALLIAIIALQAAVGSLIIMSDVKKDLEYGRNSGEKDAHAL